MSELERTVRLTNLKTDTKNEDIMEFFSAISGNITVRLGETESLVTF